MKLYLLPLAASLNHDPELEATVREVLPSVNRQSFPDGSTVHAFSQSFSSVVNDGERSEESMSTKTDFEDNHLTSRAAARKAQTDANGKTLQVIDAEGGAYGKHSYAKGVELRPGDAPEFDSTGIHPTRSLTQVVSGRLNEVIQDEVRI